MTRPAIRSLSLILFCLGIFYAIAPAQQAPAFKAQTELVLVPAVVTDKKGEPVHGLSKDDFVVLEKSKAQEIRVFEELTTTHETVKRAPVENANEFTNQISKAGDSKPHRLTIIVFDLNNLPTLKQKTAREAVLKFLGEAAGTLEPTAIYTIGRNGVKVVCDYTTDPALLARVIKEMKSAHPMGEVRGMEGSQWDTPSTTSVSDVNVATSGNIPGGQSGGALMQALADLSHEIELNVSSQEQKFSAYATLDGMNQIAQACAAVPGRKAMLWVSGGFPFDVSPGDMQLYAGSAPTSVAGRSTWTDMYPQYLRTWRALNDAQVVLYPIDVRGVTNSSYMDPRYRAPSRDAARNMRFQDQQITETDNAFADATGGKAFYNSNDLKLGFDLAAKDSSNYYVLGYYVTPEAKSKPGWHPISVKLRKSGLEVRARNGYFYNPTTEDLEKTRKTDLSAALYSPIDFTAIGLTVRWKTQEAGTNGNKKVPFAMVMPADFAKIDTDNGNRILLDLFVMPKKPDGKIYSEAIGRTIDSKLNETQMQQIRERGFTYTNSLELPAGDYQVRFVVRDGLNGHVGSVTARLKVE